MKAKAAVLVVAALAAAGATPPAKVVDENFENPQFPPAGWRIETQFVNASWTRQTDAGNSYALGYCQTGGNEYADASLFTGKLTLAAGNVLKYRCRYAGTKSGNLSTWYREAALMKGTELIWYYRFGESGWADYQTTLPPLVQSGSDYEFRWTFYAHGAGSGQGGNVSFTVDDVVVEIDNAAAAPASLGRVKALFR